MLKICHISNNYKPYSGGVARALEAWQRALHDKNHYAPIITLDFLGKKQQEEQHVIRVPSIIRFKYKTHPMAIPWFAKNYILKAVQQIKPDIIHVHHPFILGPIGLYIARRLSIPVTFTYHSQYEQYLHNIPIARTVFRSVLESVVNKFCNNVDGVIAPSQTIKNQLIARGIKRPMSIIPSPIEDGFFVNKTKERNAAVFKLVSVSRFTVEKNIPFLLRVMSLLNPDYFHLTLVGYGPEYEYLLYYAYTILKLSSQAVCFIIKPSREALIQYYNQADLFIFASNSETQGLVLGESMAARTPVVALNGPGSCDIIKPGVNGYLIENEMEMKTVIEYLSQNPEQLTQLSNAAFLTAEHYKSASLIESLEHWYTTLIAGKRY